MEKIQYEIEKILGTISEGKNGWKKELNMVSWNGREAKFDLRDWSEDHQKMGKGITLTREEAKNLKEVLESLEL